MPDHLRIREESRKAFFLERAKTLFGGCTAGGCVDIGVGIQHEPGCGDPIPEDVAALLQEVCGAAETMTEGFYLTLAAEASGLGMFGEGEQPPWPADLDARDVLEKYILKEVHSRLDDVADDLREMAKMPAQGWPTRLRRLADRLCPPGKVATSDPG